MVNLGLQRRWAGRPGAIERAKKRLLERGKRKAKGPRCYICRDTGQRLADPFLKLYVPCPAGCKGQP